MRKLVCGVGNALIDSEYRVSDNELAKLNLTKDVLNLTVSVIAILVDVEDKHGIVKMMPGGCCQLSIYSYN